MSFWNLPCVRFSLRVRHTGEAGTGGGAESVWWSDPKGCRKIDLIEKKKKKKWVRNCEGRAKQDVSVGKLAKVKPKYLTTWHWNRNWDWNYRGLWGELPFQRGK